MDPITTPSDLAAFFGIFGVPTLIVYVIFAIALWKVFAKAGEPGWFAIIPIVNTFVLVKIAGYSMWMGLLYLIPIVNVIFHLIVAVRVGKGFGKSTAFSVFLLWLLAPIGNLVLGFGSATYDRSRIV